jgi:hypothetical protein
MSRQPVFTSFFVVSLVILSLSLASVAAYAQAATAPAPEKPKPTVAAPMLPMGGLRGPGAQLSPEAANTAWELEAKCVARQLKLNDEKTAKLVQIYKDARASHRTAVQAKAGEGGRPDPENYAAMREIAAAERTKLETALKGVLSAEETTKAIGPLGAFSRRWDQLVTVLSGMKLEPKIEAQAMSALAAYVAESAAAPMPAQPAPADIEASRKKSQEARDKLDAEMAKILSADQLAKWKESSSRRRNR